MVCYAGTAALCGCLRQLRAVRWRALTAQLLVDVSTDCTCYFFFYSGSLIHLHVELLYHCIMICVSHG